MANVSIHLIIGCRSVDLKIPGLPLEADPPLRSLSRLDLRVQCMLITTPSSYSSSYTTTNTPHPNTPAPDNLDVNHLPPPVIHANELCYTAV